MKRLVSLLLVGCMLLPCFALAEDAEISDGIVVSDEAASVEDEAIVIPEDEIVLPEDDIDIQDVPEEEFHTPVDEEDVVLPEGDDLIMLPTNEVEGPSPYDREMVLLQPTSLSGIAVAPNHVRLTWAPVAFASYYEVYRKISGETEYTRVATVDATSEVRYEDYATIPGQVVYYRVQAINISYDGDRRVVTYSPQSNTLPFITLNAPALSDPRGLGGDTVYLNWTMDYAANSYEVEVATNVNGPFTPIRSLITAPTYEHKGLKNGTAYYYRVRSVRTISSGEKFYSLWSNIGCGTPMQKPVLSVHADGHNAVLNWTQSDGATGYVIYRGINGYFSKVAVVGKVTSFVDAGRKLGEECDYFVYSMAYKGDYACFSLSSDYRKFMLVDAVDLCAVQNTGEGQQTIDWATHAIGANAYQVYCSTSMNGLYSLVGETTETTFVVNNLAKGNTYFYKVRSLHRFANGDVSYGPWSNVFSMPEAGVLQLTNLNAYNQTLYSTLQTDACGGYVGDVFAWNVTASGGSGAYTFKYSLVSLYGAGSMVLKDFSDDYQILPKGESSLTNTFSLTLTDQLKSLINNQAYAMQVEVRDSLGAVAAIYASPSTRAEMSSVADRPTSKVVNFTMRNGESYVMEHGISEAAGDEAYIRIANISTTDAASGECIRLNGNVVTGIASGYATVLIIPKRFTDMLIVYNITVGYPTMVINSITPNATSLNTTDTLSWDIAFTGGKPNYSVNFKVYRGSTLVANNLRVEERNGILSCNYQPTVAGNYYLEVTINAADGQTATARSVTSTVTPFTAATVTPSVINGKTNSVITWVTNYVGKNTCVRRDYTLFQDNRVIASLIGTNDDVFRYTPTSAGTYVVQVEFYEADGNRFKVTAPAVQVTADGAGGGNTSGMGRVTGVRVALRRGPSTGYGIILRVNTGEYVTVISKQGGWYYVDYKGTKGWMMAQYIAY